jgi:membrane-associated protease RseP (regulator of RpoE activity)
MGTVLGAVAFAVLLLGSVFFHEFGHFATARWAGIKIRQFFVGFGPTLWSVRRGRTEISMGPDGEFHERPETEYGVKALPLGGFVKVLGMSPFEEIPPEDYPRSFKAAPRWKRAIVLVAGSVTHAITAFVVLLVIFAIVGIPDSDRPTLRVEAVYKELPEGTPSPAFAAGIRPGDRIVGVEGQAASSWEQVRNAIRSRAGSPIELDVRTADGGTKRLTLTPVRQRQDGKEVGMVGVSPALAVSRVSPVAAIGRSGSLIARLASQFVRAAPKAFALRNFGIVPGLHPSEERPVSILGAGRIAADLAASGQIATFLFFFVQVNLFIGLLNLLPLPPLDGGHLLLLGVEKVRGREVDPRRLVPIMAVVTSLLIVLAVSLLFQDIFSPVRNPFQ